MQDRMTAAEFRAQASGARCATCGRGPAKRHKYGAVAVVDPETGTRIPSKHEMRVLTALRAEADAHDWITALHPRMKIEGGHYEADVIQVRPCHPVDCAGFPGWEWCLFRLIDAKGHDTATSRKSRRQVAARYGCEVQIVRGGKP